VKQQKRKKTDKLDHIKMKSLYFKGHPQEGERMEENICKHISDKGLIARIYKNSCNNNKKTSNSIENGQRI